MGAQVMTHLDLDVPHCHVGDEDQLNLTVSELLEMVMGSLTAPSADSSIKAAPEYSC